MKTGWCEFCRDHFDADHFGDDNYHRVGPEFGPTGLTLWQLARARELATSPEDPPDWRAALLAILDTKAER